MLRDKNAVANIAVKDLEKAKRFYQDVLDLQLIDSDYPEVVVFKSGNSMIIVYKSDYAGTNKATSMTWTVGDNMGEVVQALKAKGITFEHYNMPNITLEVLCCITKFIAIHKCIWFGILIDKSAIRSI